MGLHSIWELEVKKKGNSIGIIIDDISIHILPHHQGKNEEEKKTKKRRRRRKRKRYFLIIILFFGMR